ncbi:hypothetical protein LT493_10880 [Streptomyces tricolor]|nr:hypothetical protein [Streptomyces tricolor]
MGCARRPSTPRGLGRPVRHRRRPALLRADPHPGQLAAVPRPGGVPRVRGPGGAGGTGHRTRSSRRR